MRCRRRRLRLSDPHGRDGARGRRVLLIAPASSYRIGPYLSAARALGLEPLLVSQGEHSLVEAVAGGIQIDLTDSAVASAQVYAACRSRPPAAVIATDDATVALAAQIAERFGLPHNPPAAARVTRRKDLARACLAQTAVPIPQFRLLYLDRPWDPQLEGIVFPCVVKPVAMSGSRGVIRADDVAQLRAACTRTAAIVAQAGEQEHEAGHRLLIEQYLPGPEIALEGMLDHGALQVLTLFDKPEPLEGPFFEETYYVSPSRLDPALQQRAAERVAQACAAYGLRHGPVHAELRIWRGDAWVLEIAARTIGGECARVLQFGTGSTLEELVMAQAVGLPRPPPRFTGAAGVLMLPTPARGVLRRVEGVLDAAKVPGVEAVEISVREGYELVPLPEGSSYLGFVFAKGETPQRVERALRTAHARLHIVTAPVLPVSLSSGA